MNASGDHRLDARVLGPVELSVAGVPIGLDRPLVRALAVRLALARGVAVADEALAREIWGEVEISDPVKRLRVLVHRLRRSLGAHADLVQRTAAGYRLAGVPVDLVAAEEAIARAQRARQDGDQQQARVATTAALEQWRGATLADLRGVPFAETEGVRLDALRLDLRIELIEAEIATGETPASGDLERLAAEHPLHERLICLSALALYRAGRQADALTRLAKLRQALGGELGIDPSPATAELEMRLLRQDPDLLPSPRPRTRHNDLPALNWPPATAFVGRDGQRASLVDLLAGPDLITLIGPPGAGKTRLAREVAAAIQKQGRPVAWLDLARLTDAGSERIVTALAATIDVETDPVDPLARCAEALSGALLVIDNAEHLVDATASVVAALRRTTDDLSVLVTSQRALRLAGEEVHQIGPLPLGAAVALFRARSGADQTSEVETICQAVDRMPLGIELAAGLTRTLTVTQVANRIEDRLRLLVGGSRDGAARHTSLRAALDWSHDLLDEPAQIALRRLSAFAGGCTLEAAEQVIAEGKIDPLDVAALLDCLADRSLITVTSRDDGPGYRFRLLESIQAYAAEQLHRSGEEHTVRHRHAAWCAELTTGTGPHHGRNHLELVRTMSTEEPNLRAAIEWCLGSGGLPYRASDIVGPVWWYWWSHGMINGARDWLRDALAAGDDQPSAQRAQALRAAATLTRAAGDHAEALALAEQALEVHRSLGDADGYTAALLSVSYAHMTLRELDTAVRVGQEVLARTEAADPWLRLPALHVVGMALRCLDRLDEAADLFTEAHQLAAALDYRRGLANADANMARILRRRGDLVTSRELQLAALQQCHDLDQTEGLIDTVESIAELEVGFGRPAEALRLLTVAERARIRLGAPLFIPDEIDDREAALTAAHQALGPDAAEIIEAARQLSLESVVEALLA